MSYSAYVCCNCYKEGKAVRPPHEEYVTITPLGIEFNFPQKWWSRKARPANEKFYNWLSSACQHPDMIYAHEHLTNISGMASFRSAINETGLFPIISSQLPENNGGFLPLELTHGFLKELETLENCSAAEEIIHLFETKTKRTVYSINTKYVEAFALLGGHGLFFTLSVEGFSVLNKQSELLFRAHSFSQVKEFDKYWFINSKNGTRFLSPLPIEMGTNNPVANSIDFNTETSALLLRENYSYIISPLKKLCLAALETNNPVCWS